MGWNGNLLTAPISIGDVSTACHYSSNDLGSCIKNGGTNINVMAKYKPFKNVNPGFASKTAYDNARAATRYGFGSTLPQLTIGGSTPILKNNWVYQWPTGTAPTEWYRALDFDGYDENACAPIAIDVGQLVYDDKSYILLYGNSNVNIISGNNWVSDQSLSIGELLSGGSDLYSAYISFILRDTTSGTINFIVTDTTFKSFVESSYGNKYFVLFGNGQGSTYDSKTCPGVPVLSSANKGHVFDVIVCLSPGNQPSSGTAYAVYSTNLANYTPYSIGFKDGCDRTTATLGSGAFTMDGTQITSVTVSYTDTAQEVVFNNLTWKAYLISVSAVITTSGVSYSGEKTISGSLILTNGASYNFGPTPGSGNSSITQGISCNLVGNTTNQNKTLFSTQSDQYLWVLKQSGTSTSVTGSVTFDYPFNTPISKSGSKTIQIS